MKQAFVIMQIGNPELDTVFDKVIVPSLKKNNLIPKRVDKHNQGGLLKTEIIKFIQDSDIIIADLTNERPNCYLEVGYAMGIDKFRNLILTAREDHLPGSPNHKPHGPKIHFDLLGYDILFWHQDKLEEFQDELAKRIGRRLAVIAPLSSNQTILWDDEWVNKNRERATLGLNNKGNKGFMEIRHALVGLKVQADQKKLLTAANQAQIHTFGWPIGIVMSNPPNAPRSRADGIEAEVNSEFGPYDYWALKKNGDFYSLSDLFEDSKGTNLIFFDTRIVRTTEALLHCARLYDNLGVNRMAEIEFIMKYNGIENRILSSVSGRILPPFHKNTEKEIEIVERFTLSSLENELVENVKKLTSPLFLLFDFFDLNSSIYENIVNNFVAGKIS